MATSYKVLGQAASEVTTYELVSFSRSSNYATVAATEDVSFVLGDQVFVTLPDDTSFQGDYKVEQLLGPNITYKNDGVNVNSTNTTQAGSVTGFEWMTVYSCPGSTSAVTSTISITNTSNTSAYYSLACAEDNTANPLTRNMLVNRDIIQPNDTITFTAGITLDSNVKHLMASTNVTGLVVQAFGVEIS